MKYLFTTLIICLQIQICFSCDCSGPISFCNTINESPFSGSVVKGIKLKDTLHGMTFKVINNYLNPTSKDTVLVWGDTGWLCREYTSDYKTGDTLILNLTPFGEQYTPHIAGENYGDYLISFCGFFRLDVKGDYVYGRIKPGIDSMRVEDFENSFFSEECTDIDLSIPFQSDMKTELSPNPISDFLNVSSGQTIDKIRIVNSEGGEQVESSNIKSTSFDFDLTQLPVGLYFVVVYYQERKYETFKIIKI